MVTLRNRHYNNCLRCPLIFEGERRPEEPFRLGSLNFDLLSARKLCRDSMLHRVDPTALAAWLEVFPLLPEHVDHLPTGLGPGIMVTLPNGLGRPLIDGNHRAARALREGVEFLAFVLPESRTRKLLIRTMGRTAANRLWNRLCDYQFNPNDVQQGEER